MSQTIYIGSEELVVATPYDISDISGFATQKWVEEQNYATEAWVGGQGYLTSVPAVYADYELTPVSGVEWTDTTVRVYKGGLCVFLGNPSSFTFANSVEIGTLPSGALPAAYSKLSVVMSTDTSSNYGCVLTLGTSGIMRVQYQNGVSIPTGKNSRIEGMPVYYGGMESS